MLEAIKVITIILGLGITVKAGWRMLQIVEEQRQGIHRSKQKDEKMGNVLLIFIGVLIASTPYLFD